MPIIRRTRIEPPPPKPRFIIRRKPTPDVREFADSVEEYVFSIPGDPMSYTDLVCNWILPYQHTGFEIFGLKLRITPRYETLMDGNVKVNGLLVEVIARRNLKKKITGPRGTWHGQIKVFVKSSVGAIREQENGRP